MGLFYFHAFAGIAFGTIGALKKAFEPTGALAYILVIVGCVVIAITLYFLAAGLLLSLGSALQLAATRCPTPRTARRATFYFAAVAVTTFLGLLLSRFQESDPDMHSETRVESYFFLWPILFAILAGFYGTLFRNTRNA